MDQRGEAAAAGADAEVVGLAADQGRPRDVAVVGGLAALTARPRVVTLGTFDGVHRGHRYLLETTVTRARELGLPALAVTFEPIPAMVLRPESFAGRISTPAEKLSRIASTGVDEVCVIPFGRDLAERTAEDFVAELVRHAAPVEVVTGEAFALGRGRAGGTERLAELGAAHGFAFRALPRVEEGEEVVSSSAIRRAVMEGDAERAGRLLGRPFRVTGPVVHSAHYGRQIGFPTANVLPDPGLVPVADGIYVSLAVLPDGGEPRPAMTYVGTRPTVNTGARQVETHLLDFDGDLYGHTLGVDLLHRLRPDEHFAGVDAMVAQLRDDERATRSYLAARSGD